MEDYGKLVYLDVQKTGSTFICAFLRECAKLGLHHSEQHARVAEARPGTIYAISVRHPLEQYVSLFRYGLDEKGAVFSRIKSIGREDLYHADGFDDWIRFILDAANAKVLGDDDLMAAMLNSLLVALLSSAAALVLGLRKVAFQPVASTVQKTPSCPNERQYPRR